MTQYNVHLYREMRLSFVGIEADTPDAAAAIAREKQTEDADNIEDREGETLSALVDVVGDEEYEQSVTVDFEAERQRKAAPALLAALDHVRATLKLRHLDEATDAEVEEALAIAEAAIVQAKPAGFAPGTCSRDHATRFDFTHEPEENPDRAYVLVDGRFDVAIIRTAEGIVIDVYPKDWIDPIDTMTVWDEQVAATHDDGE